MGIIEKNVFKEELSQVIFTLQTHFKPFFNNGSQTIVSSKYIMHHYKLYLLILIQIIVGVFIVFHAKNCSSSEHWLIFEINRTSHWSKTTSFRIRDGRLIMLPRKQLLP